MNNKYLFTAIAIIIVIAGGLFFYKQTQAPTEPSPQSLEDSLETKETNDEATETNTTETPTTSNAKESATQNAEQGQLSGEPTAPDDANVAVVEVMYDGKTFSPSTVTIQKGDIVVFKNNSGKDFWPASDSHPSHTIYPEFDSKAKIASGSKFQFKFTKVGSWGYHDHINSSATGTVIVK